MYILRCIICGARMDETQPLSHSPLSTPGLKIKNFVHTHKERLNTGVCVCVCTCVTHRYIFRPLLQLLGMFHEVINTVQLSRGH